MIHTLFQQILKQFAFKFNFWIALSTIKLMKKSGNRKCYLNSIKLWFREGLSIHFVKNSAIIEIIQKTMKKPLDHKICMSVKIKGKTALTKYLHHSIVRYLIWKFRCAIKIYCVHKKLCISIFPKKDMMKERISVKIYSVRNSRTRLKTNRSNFEDCLVEWKDVAMFRMEELWEKL